MKLCLTCRRYYPDGLIECAQDGAVLTEIGSVLPSVSVPFDSGLHRGTVADPVNWAGIHALPGESEMLPDVDEDVPPHDDWATWNGDQAEPPVEVGNPSPENRAEQRRLLLSAGLIFGAIGFLLQLLASTPTPTVAAPLSTGSQVASSPVDHSVPPLNDRHPVQRMSASPPEERRFVDQPRRSQPKVKRTVPPAPLPVDSGDSLVASVDRTSTRAARPL